jgi:hypothetical protein
MDLFFGREAMNIDHLRALLSLERAEPVVVCSLEDTVLAGIVGAFQTRAVLLSWETVVKQNRRHPDIGIEEYCLIPEIVRTGMAMWQGNRLVFSYQHSSGRRFWLVIKATLLGHELFVASLYRTKPRRTKAALGRSILVRKHT